MKKIVAIFLVGALSALLLVGCATPAQLIQVAGH